MNRFFQIFNGILFFLLGCVFFISCFSYNVADTSLNTASSEAIQNILGSFGAISADLILQFFGISGFLIPIFLISSGVMLLRGAPLFKTRVSLFLIGLFTFAWTLGPSFIQTNGSWLSSKGGGFIGFYLSQWIGKSALFPFYIQALFYLASITFILLGLNIPFIRFSKWFSSISCSVAKNMPLPAVRKLSFKLPSFSFPKISFKKNETVSSDIIIENNESFEVEAEPEKPEQKEKQGSIFSFNFNKKSEPIKERIEPVFTQEDDFDFTPISMKEEENEETFEPAAQKKSLLLFKRKEKEEKAQETSSKKEEAEVLELPSSTLLDPIKSSNTPSLSKEVMLKTSKELEDVLAQFSITGKVVTAHPGPVVTLYEFQPAAGIKSARIITLADDIAMKMRVVSVRIAVIPGTDAVGIEMPNLKREVVYIREMIEHPQFKNHTGALPLILGKDIGGAPIFADLAKMPHLLVAGTTGSGKSVAINTMVLSLIYKFTPAECRLIMVDPKMVELSVYNRIPHLLTPVVVDPEKVVIALKWAVREMEDRYTSMSHLGVRNIEGYNQKLKQAAQEGKNLTRRVQTGFDPETGRPIYEEQEFDLTPIPYIVIIIDEMADLMGRCGKEVDPLIQRLAQMARAVGIHLILATQRPSVDVITGTIKSNFPSRMSFQVRSKTDSRTILDEHGAERLLGKGDMLFMPAGQKPQRVHGPFVSDHDVEQVVHHWELQAEPQYLNAVTTDPEAEASLAAGAVGGGNVPNGGDLYDQAVAIILRDQKVSTSYVQRQLRIGYNKAADLIDRMEAEGVISKPNVAGKREILVPTVNA
ncbi:MAG: DNA translocase FtsK 4TM domain-containing protein [Alphaproteobacteria bacterium]|nr:DNA translocase FtsK 4TM domain-containing protein [Alphaproteobacteria bacterium]